MICEVFTNT